MKIFDGTKRFFKRIANYLVQVRSELRKVIWPSFGQVRVYTAVVITAIVGIGAILWGTDGFMAFALGRIIGK